MTTTELHATVLRQEHAQWHGVGLKMFDGVQLSQNRNIT